MIVKDKQPLHRPELIDSLPCHMNLGVIGAGVYHLQILT